VAASQINWPLSQFEFSVPQQDWSPWLALDAQSGAFPLPFENQEDFSLPADVASTPEQDVVPPSDFFRRGVPGLSFSELSSMFSPPPPIHIQKVPQGQARLRDIISGKDVMSRFPVPLQPSPPTPPTFVTEVVGDIEEGSVQFPSSSSPSPVAFQSSWPPNFPPQQPWPSLWASLENPVPPECIHDE